MHSRGAEASVLVTARLEALAIFSCLSLSDTLPIVNGDPL